MRNAYAMSMIMGEGINNGEPDDGEQEKKNGNQREDEYNTSHRMKALQEFASQSAKVPDAKHSKAR